ncbi:unnamed protein product [marine sediment metagenome]|uniref:Uncharacterized protein n=1 Tax=marine sediment metagenome TaxID=412755 RepID=X0SJE4_9ZZZZ
MRIGDVVVEGKNVETLILPRPKFNIVIKAEAVIDMDEFDSLQPKPKPKYALVGSTSTPLDDDTTEPGKVYKLALNKHEEMRDAWLMVTSLIPSDIEWDTVDPDVPSTCLVWQDELKKAGFTWAELGWIQRAVMRANSLDDAYLKECFKAFQQGLEAEVKEESSGPTEELSSTPSLPPA